MSPSNSIYLNYSTFNLREQRKKSRLIAGLLLIAVVILHIGFALYLLNAPNPEVKKPLVIMEVVMLSKPELPTKQAVKEPPPAPPPVKKAPIKPKPVVKPEQIKKPVVVKKTVPKPEPSEIKEIIPIPAFTPAPPVATQAPATAEPSNSKAAAKPNEATGHGHDDSKTVVSGVVPLVRVPPKYPARAANRHIEGRVEIEFTIKTDGSVDNTVVVSSEPEGIFDDAALNAISKWKFKEKIVNGVAVPQRAVQTLQFKLEN